MSSELKRKREEPDTPQKRREEETTEPAGDNGLPYLTHPLPGEAAPAPITKSSTAATPATVSNAPQASPAGAGSGPRLSGTSAKTVIICGKEVALQGGGKRRKLPVETMVLTAYKKELALTCKANDMVSALEMYSEMKAKGIKQDLGIHQMVLAVCGGSPGEKDTLDPGNGATPSANAAANSSSSSANNRVASSASSAVGSPGTVAGSAQQNTAMAADAAIQILEDVTKDPEGNDNYLPESAYTGVIRACCLDGRADKGREVLERLKRTRTRPRLRTYAPLLEVYARLEGRLQDCMAVWREAVSREQQLTMTEREYLSLIKACTRAKDESCFAEVMSEYMEDVLQPRSRASWDVLKAWFRVAPSESSAGVDTEDGERGRPPNGICSVGSAREGPKNGAGREEVSTAVTPIVETKEEFVASPRRDEAGNEGIAEGEKAGTAEEEGGEAAGKHQAPDRDNPVESAASIVAAPSADVPIAPAAAGTEENGNGCSVAVVAVVTTAMDRVECGAGEAVTSAYGKGWKVSECKVAPDGSCQSCGEILTSIELSADEEQRLLKQVEVLVCTNEKRTKQWEGYTGWLERHARERYNVIIDGANVGYYKKGAADTGELADLKQVDWAVKKFEAEGKKPLVVLHSRHLAPERLSTESKEIVNRWREDKTLQSCAPNNNDDWYWLYAAVLIGGRVLVLTNDEMRDHHFSMLSHRSFERWKERHQTRFTFGDWREDMREVLADEPRAYSKRTQMGNEGKSWHFPLEGSNDWLCANRQ